jgi:hypothetical protein
MNPFARGQPRNFGIFRAALKGPAFLPCLTGGTGIPELRNKRNCAKTALAG